MVKRVKAFSFIFKFLILFFASAFVWEVVSAMLHLNIPPQWDAVIKIVVVCGGLYFILSLSLIEKGIVFIKDKLSKEQTTKQPTEKVSLKIIRVLIVLLCGAFLFGFGYQKLVENLDEKQNIVNTYKELSKINLFIEQTKYDTGISSDLNRYGLLIEFGAKKVKMPVRIEIELNNEWLNYDYWWDYPDQRSRSDTAKPFDSPIVTGDFGNVVYETVVSNVTRNLTAPYAKLRFDGVKVDPQTSLYLYFTSNKSLSLKDAFFSGRTFIVDGQLLVSQ
jgi:hypothetical protein